MAILPNLILIGGLLAICLVVVMPILNWLARQDERKRQYEHAQRLRAIEVGRPLNEDVPWWYPPRLAGTLAIVVPIGVFALALAANALDGPAWVPIVVWGSAGAVGVAAVVSGAWLSAQHARMSLRDLDRAATDSSKPLFLDSDAYDVVSRRG